MSAFNNFSNNSNNGNGGGNRGGYFERTRGFNSNNSQKFGGNHQTRLNNENNPHKWIRPGHQQPMSHSANQQKSPNMQRATFQRATLHRNHTVGKFTNSGPRQFNNRNQQGSARNVVQKMSMKASHQHSQQTNGKYQNQNGRNPSMSYPSNTLQATEAMLNNAWFKVTISYGSNMEKPFILNSIKSLCEQTPFIPFCYQNLKYNSVFYVRGNDQAHAIMSCNMKIMSPMGTNIKINVSETEEPPSNTVDKSICAKIYQLVKSRYDQQSKTMNLMEICSDPVFATEEIYLSLNKQAVVDTLLAAIKELNEEVENLCLMKNSLTSLQFFKSIDKFMPKIKRLHLGENKLPKFNQLQYLSSIADTLVEIVLSENPLYPKPKNQEHYMEMVRQHLPNIEILDMQQFNAPIKFDLKQCKKVGKATLPELIREYFVNDGVKNTVYEFMEKYFSVFDSNDRDKLLDAYDDTACFSMSYQRPKTQGQVELKDVFYLKNSINFLKNDQIILHNIKNSKVDIIYALKQMPQTQHIADSLSIQCIFCDQSYMLIRIVGSYTEKTRKRNFQRMFMLKEFDANRDSQSSKHLKIMNDMLTITSDISDHKNMDSHYPLVVELCKATRLRPKWAEDCLKQNEWDYTKALMMFEDANSKNMIPSEAFIPKPL